MLSSSRERTQVIILRKVAARQAAIVCVEVACFPVAHREACWAEGLATMTIAVSVSHTALVHALHDACTIVTCQRVPEVGDTQISGVIGAIEVFFFDDFLYVPGVWPLPVQFQPLLSMQQRVLTRAAPEACA